MSSDARKTTAGKAIKAVCIAFNAAALVSIVVQRDVVHHVSIFLIRKKKAASDAIVASIASLAAS